MSSSDGSIVWGSVVTVTSIGVCAVGGVKSDNVGITLAKGVAGNVVVSAAEDKVVMTAGFNGVRREKVRITGFKPLAPKSAESTKLDTAKEGQIIGAAPTGDA